LLQAPPASEDAMRVFLAGGTGAVGARLVPILVAGGHHVVATTRSPGKRDRLRKLGAEPLVLDGLDRDAVMKAVVWCQPGAIIHQMTSLRSLRSLRRFDKAFALTNRLRTEGTRNLLDAAAFAGTRRIVAQSYAGWPNERHGGRVKTEDDPLDVSPPASMRATLAAIRVLEDMVVNAPDIIGTVVRYGSLYGPGTALSEPGEIVRLIRRRRFPLVGDGAGVWSFIHVDDAARATRLALEHGAPGLYNIVDDEPAEVSVWLPELARVLGAKPPLRVPAWVGRLALGEAGASMMTQARGASNAKAKRTLGWTLEYGSWRDGFRHGLRRKPRTASTIAR
jgi:nucleoside-diphosphate-sugar epimerase